MGLQTAGVIKNAVLHPVGEQPMLADLFVSPRPTDVTLLCTNLRTIDGKRPTSIDSPDSLFMIPLATIRFIEVPANQLAAATAGLADTHALSVNGDGRPAPSGNGLAAAHLPEEAALVPIPGRELYSVLRDADEPIEMDAGGPPQMDQEPDEDLLRRIRDI